MKSSDASDFVQQVVSQKSFYFDSITLANRKLNNPSILKHAKALHLMI